MVLPGGWRPRTSTIRRRKAGDGRNPVAFPNAMAPHTPVISRQLFENSQVCYDPSGAVVHGSKQLIGSDVGISKRE